CRSLYVLGSQNLLVDNVTCSFSYLFCLIVRVFKRLLISFSIFLSCSNRSLQTSFSFVFCMISCKILSLLLRILISSSSFLPVIFLINFVMLLRLGKFSNRSFK